MATRKIHMLGADPFEQRGGSVYRYLGCTNPDSELAVVVHMNSEHGTYNASRVTCRHCIKKLEELKRKV